MFRQFQTEKCSNCNTRPSDWLDPDGVPLEHEPHELHSLKCQGCQVMAEEQDRLAEQKQRGIYLYFQKKLRALQT